MAGGSFSRLTGVLAVLVLTAAAALAPAASADPIIGPQDPDDPQADSPWQAGTCTSDLPTCSVATPPQYFEAAGAHPPVGFTQFIVNTEPGPLLGPKPVGNLEWVRVDLPAGLTVNPQSSAQQCVLEGDASPSTCPPLSKVGTSAVTVTNPDTGLTLTLPSADVFNIVPKDGQPARFGFSVLGNDVFLEADVAWESDYHEYFTIHATQLSLPGLAGLEVARIAKNRLVFDGRSGPDGTFITSPTTCLGPAEPGSPVERVYSTLLRASGYEPEFLDPSFPAGSAFVEAKIPPGTSPKGCPEIPFEPSIAVQPGTDLTDSPAGAAVEVKVPEVKGGVNRGSSHVRSARVTLPAGMGLNPSAANGLVACEDSQFKLGSREAVECPAGSRIGTVEVDTPPLPDGSLSGPVFVGRQLGSDPASGDLYRIFVLAESSRYDISARLLGKVEADPGTGRLTTVFDGEARGSVPLPGLPQVPFESFRVKLDGGARAALTSPPTCGPNTTATQMTPWSSARGTVPVGQPGGPSGAPPATASADFTLANAPGGGACAKTMAERPFSLGFAAGTVKPVGGTFSPLRMEISRADGNQELKGVDVTLPPGLTAKLAGVAYCPQAALNAAAARSGAAEKAAPSCPASSRVGRAAIVAGSGPAPLRIDDGTAYLAGPYRGAPLSLAIVTPATAGPFDLGTVVVRVALFVDPRTAQVRADSDPIPHVYGGATLSLRSVAVTLDRRRFSLNPTSCGPLAFGGALLGGGADPADPPAFSRAGVEAPYRARGCERLSFKPRLFLRTFGATKRARNPKLRAVLRARPGDANIGRSAVIMPRAIILDQSSISKVCTRVQFAARACPKNSIYGHARAVSPLLDEPLAGPVYLRSSDNVLPDLVADLRGQVNIELAARTDSVRGRLRSTFDVVPDVPVKKFMLTIRGGRSGLLTNSRNLCPPKKSGKRVRVRHRKSMRAIVRFKGHNGKKANRKQAVRVPCRGR